MEDIKKLLSYEIVDKEDIPNLDLYMDQLLLFIEEKMNTLKRHEEDKTLTKTMVNNYVKGKVISSPVKKKYNKNQIMKLIMISQLKNILQLSDLKELCDSTNLEEESLANYYDFYRDEQKRIYTELMNSSEIDIDNKDEIIKSIITLSVEADIRKRVSEILIDKL